MKKSLVLIATIVAVILIGNVLAAYAQHSTQPAQRGTGVCSNEYTCPLSGTLPYGGGMTGGRGMMGNQAYSYMMGANGMHQQIWTAVARALGMTYDQVTQSGQTIAQLAQAKGISLDTVTAATQAAAKNALVDLVKQGVMTQAQADWMAEHMDDMPMFNFGTGYGPGMMGSGRGAPGGMMGGRGYAQPTGPQG